METKRGLSDVVTTALIILLAIVSVVIVWSFVKPVIESTGEELTLSCLKVQVKPLECSLYNDKVAVVVERGSDSGEIKLSDVRLIFHSTSGETKLVSMDEFNPFDRKTRSINYNDLGISRDNIAEVGAAGIVKTASGEDKVCQQSVKVACSKVNQLSGNGGAPLAPGGQPAGGPPGGGGNQQSGGCTNDCATLGLTQCSSNIIEQTCGNYDSNTCLEWGGDKNCAHDCDTTTNKCSTICDGLLFNIINCIGGDQLNTAILQLERQGTNTGEINSLYYQFSSTAMPNPSPVVSSSPIPAPSRAITANLGPDSARIPSPLEGARVRVSKVEIKRTSTITEQCELDIQNPPSKICSYAVSSPA